MLTLSYLTVNGAGPLEHVEAAAAGGFDGADLRVMAPTHIPIRRRVVGNKPLIAELKRVCERSGVKILNLELITLKPGAKIASFLPVLETAAELGARNMLTVIEDMDPSEVAEQFEELCATGKDFGQRMALEFMSFRSIKTIHDAVALVRKHGAGNAGVLIDALHLAWTGGTPADVARLTAEDIAYVQICDAPIKVPPLEEHIQFARTGRLYPGKGELPLFDLLDAVPEGIPISVEVPYKAHARRTVVERAKLAGAATRSFLKEYKSIREHKTPKTL